jgi:predicted small lipoprotein YifL
LRGFSFEFICKSGVIMKKTLSLILALLMILTLASCGEGGKETPDNTSPDVTEIADATNVTKKT